MRSERLARHQLIRLILVAVSPVPPVKTAIREVKNFIVQYDEGVTYTRDDLGRFVPPEEPA